MFNKKEKEIENRLLDTSSLKVVFFASAVIVLAVFLTGGVSYFIAKNAVVSKLKSRDLMYIAQSITAKIDGRIARAKETSLILSRDPVIKKWVKDREEDEILGQYAKEKITDIAHDYDYQNAFIVSAVTHHYWAEGGVLIDTVSSDDPDDSWFYEILTSGNPMTISIDFNDERNDTFAFIDALMADEDKALAVVGVGLNFKGISNEFESYKFGENSNMWLVDGKGKIFISEDIDQLGKNLTEFLPEEIGHSIIANAKNADKTSNVLEYKNTNGDVYDLIYVPCTSTDWNMVLQIPRYESVSILDAVKFNTGLACFITLFLLVIMFNFLSRKIANPYRRAVELAQEMERQVKERTRELNEKNEKIMDSIAYAKMIQESILPSSEDLGKVLGEHFVLWKPRDIVGGDFYHVRSFEHGSLLLVGDCTGHGVPGALMTMAVNSILRHIIDEETIKDPAWILGRLNVLLKQTLYGGNSNTEIDDGLDAGVIYIPVNGPARFAGARVSLYTKGTGRVRRIKGNGKGIGYKRTPDLYKFTNYEIMREEKSTFYITTDGYLHQNGGEKDFSLGNSRFEAAIERCSGMTLSEQKEVLEHTLNSYMGSELQRDDITVIGCRFR